MSEQNCHTCHHVSNLWAPSALPTVLTFLEYGVEMSEKCGLTLESAVHKEGRSKPAYNRITTFDVGEDKLSWDFYVHKV